MKKTIKIIIALMVLFNFNIVNAKNKDHYYVAKGDFKKSTGISLNSDGESIEDYNLFKLYDENDTPHKAFCIDPGLPAGANNDNNGTVFDVKETLLGIDSMYTKIESTHLRNALDAGLVYIASGSYNNQGRQVAAQLAMREYAIIINALKGNFHVTHQDFNNYSDSGKKTYRIHNKIAWGNFYPKHSRSINALLNIANNVSMPYEEITYDFSSVRNLEGLAEDIFKDALIAARNYYNQKGEDMPYLSFKKKSKIVKNNEITVTYHVIAKNFKNDPKLKAIFDCENCQGVNPKITIKDSIVTGTNIDLMKYLNNGSGEFDVKVIFTLPDNFDCDNSKINYTFTVEYSDKLIPGCAEVVTAANTTGNQKHVVQKDKKIVLKESITCTGGPDEPDPILCTVKMKNDKCKYKGDAQNSTEMEINEGYEYKDNCDLPENIKQCVVGNKDKAGNSFATDLAGDNNKYCTVYCKEDYHFTFPNAKYVNSGRYFVLDASAEGKRSCYTGKIKTSNFEQDLKAFQKENKDAYEKYKNDNSEENKKALKLSISKIQSAISDFNACSSWQMTYDFNPKLYFEYDESYNDDAATHEMHADITAPSSRNVLMCSSDNVNNSYSKCNGSEWAENAGTKTINVTIWEETGSSSSDIKVSKAQYVKQSMTGLAKYITPTQFYNVYPGGYIGVITPGNEGLFNNVSPIENGLPTGYSAGAAQKNYRIYAKDVGEYSDGSLGRIWGDSDSVLVSLFNDSEVSKCVPKGDLTPSGDYTGAVYTCRYIINCPDCPLDCPPEEICEDSDCKEDCDVECIDCIVYSKAINFTYRPISTNDFNPSGRKMGPNWDINTTNNSTALRLKAIATMNEITANGDKVFDEKSEIANNVVYKVKLNSKLISQIRKYNSKNAGKGGYLNNSLKCYDYKNEDGNTYKNVMCYSTFIDEFINSFSISVDRPSSDSQRKNYNSNIQYWTLWTEKVNDNSSWDVTTSDLAYYKSGYGKKINIGPSWK